MSVRLIDAHVHVESSLARPRELPAPCFRTG
jgi:adenine deaminase